MQKFMEAAEKALNMEFFNVDNEFQSGFISKTTDDVKRNALCTANMDFTVKDWKSARPTMQKFIEATADEPNCGYFGWSRAASKDGDKLSWKASFVDGDAVREHFKRVKTFIEDLSKGPAKVNHLEIHGPHDEVEKIKKFEEVPSSAKYFEGDGPAKIAAASESALEK